MERFIIEKELIEALLQYLKARPYAEVYEGIKALESLKPLDKEDE